MFKEASNADRVFGIVRSGVVAQIVKLLETGDGDGGIAGGVHRNIGYTSRVDRCLLRKVVGGLEVGLVLNSKDVRHLRFHSTEHCGGLNNVHMLMQMGRQAVTGCPHELIATLLVFPDMVGLDGGHYGLRKLDHSPVYVPCRVSSLPYWQVL